MWFNCVLKKVDDNKIIKFIVKEEDYTKCETACFELASSYDATIESIVKIKIDDCLPYRGSEDVSKKWFLLKTEYTVVNEKTDKVRKITNSVLIESSSILKAIEDFYKEMKTTMITYDVVMIKESQCLEVIH